MLLWVAMLTWLMIFACSPKGPLTDSAEPVALEPVAWNGGLGTTTVDVGQIRQWLPRRSIMHLHSPWSHDACDGVPLIDGRPDMDCLQNLRDALCTTSVDIAYLSDHPTHAADQPFEDLFHAAPEDERIELDGKLIATRISCEDGHTVLWRAGIEDELMPLGLEGHAAPGDPEENHRLYNEATGEAIAAAHAAGALVSMAHTEGKTLEDLSEYVAMGLEAVELFNLHAMFDPSKRSEDLGLDPLGWTSDIAPFTRPDGTGEPDLFFLGVFEEQTVSIERWDALQEIDPVVGFAGTDAHQNVLPFDLRDGERGDSYRRMLRWFSNHVLVDASETLLSPQSADAALAAGRVYTAFEILGTPTGLDFHLKGAEGAITEMGGTGQGTELVVECPTLSAASPTNTTPPEITATIFKNGSPWNTGCGTHTIDGPGNYRTRVDIIPYHLTDFLGETPDEWLHSYPWVYTNPIRVL
jgi:hypothetical protein